MSKRTGRNGVLLVVPTSDFAPTRSWELPATVLSGKLIAERQYLADALGYSRIHNQRQLDAGPPVRTWCVPIRRGHVYCLPVPAAADIDAAGDHQADIAAAMTAALIAQVRELRGEPLGPYEAALVQCPPRLVHAIRTAAVNLAAAMLAELDAAGDGELSMVLDHDIEVTAADLVAEGCA